MIDKNDLEMTPEKDFWDSLESEALDLTELDGYYETEIPRESRAQRREREEAEQREAKRAAREAAKTARTERRSPNNQARSERKAADDPMRAEKKQKKAAAFKGVKITLIAVFSVLMLLALGAAAGGYFVTNSGVTLPNVYAGGTHVGGLTPAQVEAKLTEAGWDKRNDSVLKVTLPAGVGFELNSCDSGALMTKEAAVKAAWDYGHGKNWFSNLYKYLLNYIAPYDIDSGDASINAEYIKTNIAKAEKKLEEATADNGYEIDEEREKLIMLKGGGQIKIDEDALFEAAKSALLSGKEELSFDTLKSEPAMPDFKKLHDMLAVEPSDAYFEDNFEVVDEVNGVRFEVAEAEKIWKAGTFAEKIEIPMKLTKPEVTGDDLRAMLFRDVLGEQTTYYTYSVDNRINNVNLAASRINGIILLPGEELSYNETIGKRTEEAGFLPAGAYDDGEVVEELGGGICQVSSTLYSACLFGQIQILDRTNHFFKVDYLDWGMDATVSWPKPDFRIANSRDYPIKIEAVCDNDERSLTVRVMGTNVDGTYVQIRRDVFGNTGEYGEFIGYSVHQYRDIYAADGTFLRTEEYNYNDIYYNHDYKEVTENAKAEYEAMYGTGEDGGEGGGEDEGQDAGAEEEIFW